MATAVGKSWLLADRGNGRGDMLVTEYYFSNAGDDSNDGSESNPFETIAKLNTLTLFPGDKIFFRRGDTFDDARLVIDDDGSDNFPIVVDAYDSGARPIIRNIRVEGDYVTLQNLDADNNFTAPVGQRVIEVRGDNFIADNLDVHNGERDGFDIRGNLSDVQINNCEIYQLVAGSFGTNDDAHGIRISPEAGNTCNVTVTDTVMYQFSGDCIQCDPSRAANFTANVTIRGGEWYTEPLAQDLGGWLAGQRPGEDGFDTKTDEPGPSTSIVNIDVENLICHGWLTDNSPFGNPTPFNLKERCSVKLNRLTLYDNQHGVRIRSLAEGNPDVELKNSVIYNCTNGLRTENGFAPVDNLNLYNNTFGENITNILQEQGGSIGTNDIRNNGVLGTKPASFSDPSNLELASGDFVNSGSADYRLLSSSSAVGGGVDLSAEGVLLDRAGNPRSVPYNVGAFTGSVSDTAHAYFDLLVAHPNLEASNSLRSPALVAQSVDIYGNPNNTTAFYDASVDAMRQDMTANSNTVSVHSKAALDMGFNKSTGTVFFCWDHQYEQEWLDNKTPNLVNGNLETHKMWRIDNANSGARIIEIRARYINANASQGVAAADLRVYNDVPGWGWSIQPVPGQLTTYYYPAAEWSRQWVFIDLDAEQFTWWVASENQPITLLFDQLQWGGSMGPLRMYVGTYNSSQTGRSGPALGLLARNLVALTDITYAEAVSLVAQNSW